MFKYICKIKQRGTLDVNGVRFNFASLYSNISRAQPQGPPLTPSLNSKTGSQSMLKYIHDVQQKYPDSVVLVQVGAFMEIYFDQAVEIGSLLNLKVARKNQKSPVKSHNFVNMVGFPLSQKSKFERILVRDLGKTIVTLMQNSEYVIKGGTEEEKRPITRILTPGTLLDESLVDQKMNNYLAVVQVHAKESCIMWLDVASGKVQYQLMLLESLGNALCRICPSEILINRDSMHKGLLCDILAEYAPQATLTRHKFPPLESFKFRSMVRQRYDLEKLGHLAGPAFIGLFSYIDTCMPDTPIDVQFPEQFWEVQAMQLDSRARDALEIDSASSFTKSGGSKRGSLLNIIRRTRTQSGSRLLQNWLAAPLQDPDLIEDRLNKVQLFMSLSNQTFRNLQELLSELPDGFRIIQKLFRSTVDPLDLVSFAKSVETLDNLRKSLKKIKGIHNTWLETMTLVCGPLKIASKIKKSINIKELIAEPDDNTGESTNYKTSRKMPAASSATSLTPATNRDYVPVLNSDVSTRLREIYQREAKFSERESNIISRIKQEYGPSADLRWSPSHQFYVYIVLNGENEPNGQNLLARSKKTAYVADPEWTQLGNERLSLSSDLRKEEELILHRLREEILSSYLTQMRKLYSLADEIDVHMSLAALAIEKKLVRPQVVEDASTFDIKDGRHITVETGLALGGYTESTFISNDCKLSEDKSLCMITGPNMGGKSTYIRQNAIIALLAHIGSFVPAKSAKLGVVDRIFCRVGAGDDLYNGRSTFMMEMLETASILNCATHRSLAILDEVGRGTSGKEGVAIAYACVKHLVLRKRCRTLFATHYGLEIWDKLSAQDIPELTQGIQLLQASISANSTEKMSFNYKLKPGISNNSCGLLIAGMAGFPKDVLNDATIVAQ